MHTTTLDIDVTPLQKILATGLSNYGYLTRPMDILQSGSHLTGITTLYCIISVNAWF